MGGLRLEQWVKETCKVRNAQNAKPWPVRSDDLKDIQIQAQVFTETIKGKSQSSVSFAKFPCHDSIFVAAD